MEACLIIVKLAMARLAEDDEQVREEKETIMREHLDSCPSCTSFIENLGVRVIEESTRRSQS